MTEYPKVIASHIIRGANNGDHGGLYLIDFNTDEHKRVLNWNEKINWSGRGADRGLRGIKLYKDNVIVVSATGVFFFDLDFKLKKQYTNPHLSSIHEIHIDQDILYLTSTGFDSIILFDLASRKFIEGIFLRKYKVRRFDPMKTNNWCKKADYLHINNVFVRNNQLYFTGTNTVFIHQILRNELRKHSQIPNMTHNCHIFDDEHILFNDTKKDRIVLRKAGGPIIKHWFLTKVPKNKMIDSDVSKQPFARGLAYTDDWLIGGSTPGMVSLYDFKESRKKVKDIIISDYASISIHGLELWPHEV